METFTIGQLAKTAKMTVQTIRYYERQGLIPLPVRRASGYRQFYKKDLNRLRFIKHAKSIGFTLREISEMLTLKSTPLATCGDVTEKIEAKLVDLEAKIESLISMKETLIRLKEDCNRPTLPSKDCPILESLDTEEIEYDGKKQVK